ncbi:MAG: glucose-1-phosphate thymidylyltransferase, partial [Candidatus Bipolaricaulota bacterium]|nr:glucose-1-phosphate thymidylyltransferase [Candidatus Bipolaricaulota bacterium]
MKAVVLCGGEGTRMRPLSYSQPKHLIPIANRPVIERILATIAAAGITEIGIVVSPSTQEAFEAHLGEGERFGLHLDYIVQHEPKGLAHAVKCAEPFIGKDAFLLYLGDNLVQHGVEPIVERFMAGDSQAAISLVSVEDPCRFGVARVERGRIVKLVEKPTDPPSNLAIAGIYVFSSVIFSAIERIVPSTRGELEITDAIQRLIDDGGRVIPHTITGWWKDVGRPDDMIEANRLLLDQLEPQVDGAVDGSSEIVGTVEIGRGARVTKSKLFGPAILGENVVLENAVVGPYVSFGREDS